MIGVDSEKIDQYIELASGVSSTAEVSTIEDPFMNPDIDWDNPIIIDPRGFDDLFP